MNDISTNITGVATEPAVIAMAQVESKLLAVCLRRQAAAFEVIFYLSGVNLSMFICARDL